MPFSVTTILLVCFAAEPNSALDVDAHAFVARSDAGVLVRLTDADGTQYVTPPAELVFVLNTELGAHTRAGEFHAGAGAGPAGLGPDGAVALSGEGLNEVTCPYDAFAQRHAWGINHADGTWSRQPLACAHPISSYLLRPYTVINGYLGCGPPSQGQMCAAWNETHGHWGVIPTLKPHLAQRLSPADFSRQFFDEADLWLRSRLQIDLEGAWPADVAFPFQTAATSDIHGGHSAARRPSTVPLSPEATVAGIG